MDQQRLYHNIRRNSNQFFSYISNNFINGRAQWETKPEPKILDIYAKMAEEVKNGLSFDLALIDMTMPEMDGVALLERIKTLNR